MTPNLFYLKPKFLFILFSFVNLLNFIDRGIIPGATNEFNSFIEDTMSTNTPDVYLGLLQSSFIVGYSVGSLFFGHLIHHYGRFYLTGVGCGIWIIAVFFSGLSYSVNSYVFLLFARMLSGIGEASLQCSIPPWIQKLAPSKQKGAWLSLFYTAIPVGTALGYAYSSLIATTIGWEWAFYIEGIVMLPLVLFMFHISPYFPCENKTTHHNSISSQSESHQAHFNIEKEPNPHSSFSQTSGLEEDKEYPTALDELRIVMVRNLYLCFIAGYAAEVAVLIGLSTFGSSFVMGLGFFDTESEASTVFGVVVSLAGIIGTPVGGILLDKLLAIEEQKDRKSISENSIVVTPSSIGIQEELSKEMPQLGANNNEDIGSSNSMLVESLIPKRETKFNEHKRQLKAITKMSSFFCFWGSVCLCLVYWMEFKELFLFFIGLGCAFIFLCNSAINMGLMLSVPEQDRSFAIGMSNVLVHAFGDVPSPIIVGYLKDSLAPGCIASADDDGNIAASQECRDDENGLRLCILFVCVWLFWTVLFFGLAWYLNRTARLILSHCWAEQSELELMKEKIEATESNDENENPLQSEKFDDLSQSQSKPHNLRSASGDFSRGYLFLFELYICI